MTCGVKAIKPIKITPAMIQGWSESGTPYDASETGLVIGDERVYNHRVYKVIAIPADGVQPDIGVTNSPPEWELIGSTNEYAMFDGIMNSQTEQSETIQVVITPGVPFGAVALKDVDATDINITVVDAADGEIVNVDIDMVSDIGINDHYEWWYSPQVYDREAAVFDIIPYDTTTVTITINNLGGTAKCGICVLGEQIDLGQFVDDSGALGRSRNSVVDPDAWGGITPVKRAFNIDLNGTIVFEQGQFDPIFRFFSQVDATPVMWSIVYELYKTTLVYGYLAESPQPISNTPSADIAIKGIAENG
jgi:hypothetical protein